MSPVDHPSPNERRQQAGRLKGLRKITRKNVERRPGNGRRLERMDVCAGRHTVLEAGRVSKGHAPNVTVHQSKASLNRIGDSQHQYTIGL